MRKFDELVEHFAKIELDPNSHINEKEDYENEIDFYLEGVNHDSYEQYLKGELTPEEIKEYDIVEIWNAIKDYIENTVASQS